MATIKKDTSDDMSMQEILESIRKYVIEDAKPLPSSETKEEKSPQPKSSSHKGITNPQTTPVELYDADDVIELTHPMAPGKETLPPVPPKGQPQPSEPPPPPEKTKSIEPEPKPEEPVPEAKPPLLPPQPQTQTSVRSSRIAEALLSQQAVSSSAQAFSRLYEASKPSAAARPPQTTQATQATLEQAVLELARPMLQGWLNDNLPHLVETLVAREIEKIRQSTLIKK